MSQVPLDMIHFVSGIGFLILWTTTVVGVMLWLNNRLSTLLPMEEYDRKHDELMERVRQIELKVAKICATLKVGP